MEEAVHVYSQNKWNGSSVFHKSWHSLKSTARKCNASNLSCIWCISFLQIGVERGQCIMFWFLQMHFFSLMVHSMLSELNLLGFTHYKQHLQKQKNMSFPWRSEWNCCLETSHIATDWFLFQNFPKQKVSTLLLTFSAKPNKVLVFQHRRVVFSWCVLFLSKLRQPSNFHSVQIE